jgi:hypothetical protein
MHTTFYKGRFRRSEVVRMLHVRDTLALRLSSKGKDIPDTGRGGP